MRRVTLMLAAVALIASGCGKSTPSATPTSASPTPETCAPSGPVEVTAIGLKFDKTCLAAPAGKAFTVAFDNTDDGTQHNVAIFKDRTLADVLFRGAVVVGKKKVTYNVPALAAGTYFFHCDIHPVPMQGTFVAA